MFTNSAFDQSRFEAFCCSSWRKKVLEAYVSTLSLNENMIADSLDVLKNHGNMSSATVLYVLDRFMKKEISSKEYGLLTALGPGFSSEMLLLEWR
ncbi:3-oxoacyl-[acyl-carrier-protein] synthase III C-terminal domain-containing protein [Priestia megaterium]